MTRAALALLLATSAPAMAFDPAAMTPAERDAFRAEIRSYLIENPEVLVEVMQALDARQAKAQAAADQDLIKANRPDLFEDAASYSGGNPEGDLTVVEFIDYRCGYCRKAHSEVKQLIEGDGKLRYVVKELPILSPESEVAARFAVATLQVAGPEAYARLNAGLFEDFRGDITRDTLAAYARDLGIDPAPVVARMDAPEVTRVLADNHALAQRLQIQGTPTFVLGDQMLRGYVPFAHMQQIVANERG
jgi:protein-disulfide isomerase